MGIFDNNSSQPIEPQYQPVMQTSPMSQGMMNSQVSDTIASMRWEVDPLVFQLYRMLGGYEVTINEKNEIVKKRDNKVQPLMNDFGIERVISLVRGVVNPVTSLSNIDDEEANELIRQVLYAFIVDLCLNQERWDVHDGDKHTIMSIVKSVVFMQYKRSVGGHESHNFRTQTFEQNVQQSYNQPQQQSGGLFGFFRQQGKR